MISYFKKSFIRYLAYGLAIALLSFIFGLFKVNAATTKFEDGNALINNSNLPYSFNNSANGNYTTSISVMWNSNYAEQDPFDHSNILIEACTTGSYTPTNYSIVRTYAPGTSCPNSCFQQQVTYFQTDQQCPAGNGTYIGKKLYILLKSEKWSLGSGNTPYFSITDSITFKSTVNYATITTIYGVYMTDDNYAEQIQNATNQAQLNILTSTLHSDNQAIVSAVGGVTGAIGNLDTSINDVQSSVDNVNSSINNDNVSEAENKATSFFNSFSTNTHGLTSIITAPLNAISSVTSSTCSPLVLPLPFVDEDLTLPCMRPIYEEFFGDFMTLYDIVVLGIVSYWIVVRIFSLVKDFKNPEHDEVEVMEL